MLGAIATVHGKNGFLVERNVNDIVQHVLKANKDYIHLSTEMQNSIREWSWDKKSKKFFQLFRELMDN